MLSRSRKGIQSERYIKKRRKKELVTIVLAIVAIVSLVSTLFFAMRSSFLRIDSVEVTGGRLVSNEDVSAFVQEKLADSWWNLIPKANILLYPKAALVASILQHYAPVSAVHISGHGLHSLAVTITERSPFGLTCTTLTDCFYIDSNGFIYAPAPSFSPGVYVHYSVGDASTSTASSSIPALGTYLAPADTMSVARQSAAFFSGIVGVNEITMPSPGNDSGGDDYIINIKNPTPIATSSLPDIRIYMNTSEPLDRTFQYFLAFWNHQSSKNFYSIDMRYGKDIVFKMR